MRRSIVPGPAASKKAQLAAVRGWAATDSKAASAPPRVCLQPSQGGYTVGVLVQCNYGGDLRILGVPIRSEITDLRTCTVLPQPLSRPWTRGIPPCSQLRAVVAVHVVNGSAGDHEGRGSIIVIVATDAPLLPHQLERIARRVSSEWDGWVVSRAIHPAICFSRFRRQTPVRRNPRARRRLSCCRMNGSILYFRATIEATEEAVVNAMLAAQTMTGADGIRVFGLPGDRVVPALKKYNRMK